jgi:uncharacterized membrane protein YqiK
MLLLLFYYLVVVVVVVVVIVVCLLCVDLFQWERHLTNSRKGPITTLVCQQQSTKEKADGGEAVSGFFVVLYNFIV